MPDAHLDAPAARPPDGDSSAVGSHRSIGEVLALLRDEFPDITISKIRFLESQGLIDPERTPSGYRKFYEVDVVRLRWILQQQKDHYLPLKVIRGRLEQLELGDGTLFEGAVDGSESAVEATTLEVEETIVVVEEVDVVAEAAPTPAPKKAAAKKPARRARRPKTLPAPETVVADDGTAEDLTGAISGVSLTREELAGASGLDLDAVERLEEFGLIAPNPHYGDHGLFDDDALTVARIAAAFGTRGIEPRHLRMYRTFAEREAVLFEQVLLPVLRLKNPEARTEARDAIVELATLGRQLRTVYLGQAARQVLSE